MPILRQSFIFTCQTLDRYFFICYNGTLKLILKDTTWHV
jgi:hypothetical protein